MFDARVTGYVCVLVALLTSSSFWPAGAARPEHSESLRPESLLEEVIRLEDTAHESAGIEHYLHPPKQGGDHKKDEKDAHQAEGHGDKKGGHGHASLNDAWAARKSEIWNVGKFWLIMSVLVLAPYVALVLLQRNRRQEQDKLFRGLRVVAISFHKQPLRYQLICTTAAFFLSDLLAQTSHFYLEHTYLKGSKGIDLRWTLIVTAVAVLLQVGALEYMFKYMDTLWGHPQTLTKALIKMSKMQVVFLLAYLPLAVFFFATIACFLFRSVADGWDHCAPSVVVHAPRNLGGGALLAIERLRGDYLQAAFFWPASHVFNYVLMQRYAPEIRPVWDGVVVLCWNVFVRLGPAEKEAVGPVLFGGVPAPRQKVPPGIDCKRHSITAWIKWCWQKIKEFFRFCWRKIKEFFAWLWKWTCKIAAWIWKWTKIILKWLRQHTIALAFFLFDGLKYVVLCVGWLVAAAVMCVLTLLRIVLYWGIAILKGTLKVLLSIVDFIKKCLVVLFFLPDTAKLVNGGCFYCRLYPSKGQWPLEFVRYWIGSFPASKYHIRSWTPQKY